MNAQTATAFPRTSRTRRVQRTQFQKQDVIPPVNSIVRKGKVYGKVASKASDSKFADGQPRVYVVPMDDSDRSWADWWKIADLKVVGVL